MRILIIGGSGFSGWNLSLELKNKHETYSSYFSHPFNIDEIKSVFIYITYKALLKRTLDTIEPDVVVNYSGLTKVAPCEINHCRAFDLHCRNAYNLELFSSSRNKKLTHFSTDLFYSGYGGFCNQYLFTKHVNFYAKLILISEHFESSISSNYMILHLALIYGWGNLNSDLFIDWMFNLHRSNKKLLLFTDQFLSMLWVKDAISVVDWINTNDIKNETINLEGPEKSAGMNLEKVALNYFIIIMTVSQKS